MATVKIDAEKLTALAEKIQKVYEAGKKGDSYEAGQMAERKAFWDRYMNKLSDKGVVYGFFGGDRFGFSNFYPCKDICLVGNSTRVFYAWEEADHSGSLSERLRECGVVLDTSKATSLHQMFAYTAITEIPTVDCTGLIQTSAIPTNGVFAYSWGRLKTIEKIIVKEDTTYLNWFINGAGIANITVEGVIGRTFDISSSPVLTAESAKSILTHLKNYKGTDSEFTYSVLFHANVWALLDAEGNTAPNGGTWRDYVTDMGWGS